VKRPREMVHLGEQAKIGCFLAAEAYEICWKK